MNPRTAYRDLERLRSLSDGFTNLDALRAIGVEIPDLESMTELGQLAAAVVVTRGAFLAQFPEHEARIGDALYVTLDGSRRRVAVEAFAIPEIGISISDHLSASRAEFRAAAIAANADRTPLTVLDEAYAVRDLVEEIARGQKSGAKAAAAKQMGKHPSWVTQRLTLTKLSEPMKAELVAGILPVREARKFGTLPAEQQEPAWREHQAEVAAAVKQEAARREALEADRLEKQDLDWYEQRKSGQPSSVGDPVDALAAEAPAVSSEPRERGSAAPARAARISFPEEAPAAEVAAILAERMPADARRALIEALQAITP